MDNATINIDQDGGKVTLTLKSTDGPDLDLELLSLVDRTFRLRIKEVDSNRYELKNVLVAEPQTAR